ncbi:MAG: SDR family oxidoreductase, partial [Actinomycetota bacterium]
MDFSGAVTVVTGASSGFGREIARALAARGATIVAVARREERLKELIEQLGGDPHYYVVTDVSDLSQVRALARAIEAKSGRIDILINNAGIASKGLVAKTTSEELESVIRTNLISPIWTTRELLSLLESAPRKSRTPLVVNVASMAGRIPTPKS